VARVKVVPDRPRHVATNKGSHRAVLILLRERHAVTVPAGPPYPGGASLDPTASRARSGAGPSAADDRRWFVLGVVAVAQLMVVLDATIVNIALPSAQRALGFADTDRQWVVTAYALAFGSFLLLGGKLGDLFGRKTTFITGLIGFALASALGGAATSFGVLVAARALQGLFGALLAPAALATLATTFREPKERSTAFGVFGAVAGAAARSAWSSAGCSPSGCRGAGACTSTCCSRPSPSPAPSS